MATRHTRFIRSSRVIMLLVFSSSYLLKRYQAVFEDHLSCWNKDTRFRKSIFSVWCLSKIEKRMIYCRDMKDNIFLLQSFTFMIFWQGKVSNLSQLSLLNCSIALPFFNISLIKLFDIFDQYFYTCQIQWMSIPT